MPDNGGQTGGCIGGAIGNHRRVIQSAESIQPGQIVYSRELGQFQARNFGSFSEQPTGPDSIVWLKDQRLMSAARRFPDP
jgi:hypothetical protein